MGTARNAEKETVKKRLKYIVSTVPVKKHGFSSWKKRYRVLTVTLAAIILAVIATQLFYPQNRGLPLASVAGVSMSQATPGEMAKVITDKFSSSKIKLTIGPDKAVEYPLKTAGAEPNTELMIKLLTDYPLWQRFIPGSILWQPAQITFADVYYSNEPLKKFSEDKSKELSFLPQNARLAIKDGKLVADESRWGSTVKSDDVLQAINNAQPLLGKTTTITIASRRTAPERTAKDLAKVRAQAEAALAHTVVIHAADKQFSPDKIELASWVALSTNDKGDVSISVDKEKIKQYLNEVNKKVGTPAGQTNITIVDGRETGRTTGALGKAINISSLADQLANDILVPPPSVSRTAQFVDVQPSVIFNSKYSTTQAGLQAYINDVAQSKNMHIFIQQLDGEHWSAQARATESIPSGSTYKLFVALVLFDKMAKGEIHWDDPMLDTTVAGCFERMTVPSTNPCAEKWIADFGRQYINDFVHARGFSEGTSFTTGSANQTTAVDLSKFMTGLNDGTLVSGAYRDRLLDSLGRHPYRYGIPTGSAGVVHDKVGFLWDYVHDTAIVQHPRGTYIMTIMTKGQSYAAIAAATRQIERIMYP